MTRRELTSFLEAEIAAFPCKTSLHMTDADTGEVLHSHNPRQVVSSASTIKLPILLAALDQVERGAMDLAAPVVLDPASILADTQVFEPENLRPTYSFWELLYWMIVESDNTATNAVLDLLGFEAVNAFCAGAGLASTVCRRKMLDFQALAQGRDNLTTAEDQCRLYETLYRRELLPPSLTQVAWDMLTRQRSMSSFLRYIPDPVTLAHKTGGLDHVSHDAGLFWLEARRFTLAILTWDGPALDGQPHQKRFIGKLTRAIYNAYQGGS